MTTATKDKSSSTYEALAALDAERATIGAIVLNPTVLGWIELTENHFTQPLHEHVFSAIRRLWEDDKPLDEVSILNSLEVSAPSASLADISALIMSTPTASNVEHWVEILEEHRRKRVLAGVARNASNALLGGKLSSEIFDEMLDSLNRISSDTQAASETMEEVGYRVEEALLRAWDGSITTRLPSGIDLLDKEIVGLPVGVPTAIGARPGVGKSLTLWNICHAAIKRGEHVVLLTNEDNADRTYKLGLANHSGVERRQLESPLLTDYQKKRVLDAIRAEEEINKKFHTVKVHGKKMVEICRIARGLIRKYGPTIIALDYIQNVPNPEVGMSRNYGIEENLTMFDALVAEEEIVGVLMGQLKRLEPGATPTMQDFKDSGSIEQKAKLMLTLSDMAPKGQYHAQGEPNFSIGVVKNSEGLSDFEVECLVNKGLGRFEQVPPRSVFPNSRDGF